LIFFIAISLFLLIPKFFDYEKKKDIIQNILIKDYDIELIKYNSITFKIFPFPNLSLKNVDLKLGDEAFFFTTKDLKIFLNIKDIYDYKNSTIKKISLKKNKATVDIQKIGDLFIFFKKLNNKIFIQDLNLIFKRNKDLILEVKKINYLNYGYKKNKFEGELFNKKFKARLYDQDKKLDFKILNTGIRAKLNFEKAEKESSISVISKINILKNYLRLNLKIFDNRVEINESNFSNKDLSISFDSKIKIIPYFEIDNNIKINKINKQLFENLSLQKIFSNKKILKKLNSNNEINFNQKKLRKNFFRINSLNINLVNGRLIFFNKNIIIGGMTDCKGESLITEEYPRLNFNCTFYISDKKKFLKTFSISRKFDKDPLKLKVVGSLNLYNKKINLKKISSNKNYIVNEEDMNFYKEVFENILLKESFFKIFKKEKIKDFLIKVI